MDNQTGGVKRKTDDTTSQGFTPVYDMVKAVGSKLSILTAKSLKGFMLNLSVDAEDSEYLNLRGKRFTEPVTNFILKFVILTPKPNRELGYYNNVFKASETHSSFFEESRLQQYIWKKSITSGRPAICPSVANLSMFDTVNSARLMWFFLRKVNTDPTTAYVFHFLLNSSKINESGIGLLVMPTITQSTTLEHFLELDEGSVFFGKVITDDDKYYAISNVFAQIVRLFIEIGVIHFDLHPRNIMIYLTPDNEIKTLLIDFGRASNIMNGEPDTHLNKLQKEELILKKKKYYNYFLHNAPSNDIKEIEKLKYMQTVIDYIAETEFLINNPKYYRDGRRYQMSWYAKYREYYELTDTSTVLEYARLFVNAFDILAEMAVLDGNRTGIASTTIQAYERNGSFINLDNPDGFNSFIVPFPGPIPMRVPVDEIQISAPRVFLPPPLDESLIPSNVDAEPLLPPVPNEHVPSNVNAEPLRPELPEEAVSSNVNAEPLLPELPDEHVPSNVDAEPLLPHVPSNVDAESLLPPVPSNVDGGNKQSRIRGSRKNKHHKTNKRKKSKTKKNKRNQNKNTKKKRKN